MAGELIKRATARAQHTSTDLLGLEPVTQPVAPVQGPVAVAPSLVSMCVVTSVRV
jgi:hypothetical protein